MSKKENQKSEPPKIDINKLSPKELDKLANEFEEQGKGKLRDTMTLRKLAEKKRVQNKLTVRSIRGKK